MLQIYRIIMKLPSFLKEIFDSATNNNGTFTEKEVSLWGKSAVVTGRMEGSFWVKVTFFPVNRRTVLLLAAAAANIDSGRC